MDENVIDSKVVNAFVEDADVEPSGLDGLVGSSGAADRAEAYRKKHGGLWVGGRATLTPTTLAFVPNGANRAVHRGADDVEVPLSAVTSVEVEGGFGTKVVAVRSPQRTLRLRCWGARSFATEIDDARRAHG
ncbi:hypothetical protein [Rhodococcus sp. HNM0569]|uniref:hypothetical protein n=1 Tax=Rhodococcus sp. HNM0569 TaxID=2716340 RepID=UPI00146F3EC7|nr:hypothetical protein [Rhodococcus sp. HNM0569]NLU84346.1 hypothetical protein [Rhodococcus sp. HNM0569]